MVIDLKRVKFDIQQSALCALCKLVRLLRLRRLAPAAIIADEDPNEDQLFNAFAAESRCHRL